MRYVDQVPDALSPGHMRRVLHRAHQAIEMVAAEHPMAAEFWDRADLAEVVDDHWLRSPGESVNHPLACSVARFFAGSGEALGLERWLAEYGIHSWGLFRNEILGGYCNWMISELMAAYDEARERLLHAELSEVEKWGRIASEIADTLVATALLASLFTVHVGAGPMTGGAPFHVLAPGGRWGLTEKDGGRNQIDARTNVLACLLSPDKPTALGYKRSIGGDDQHPANRLARALHPFEPMRKWWDDVGVMIHGGNLDESRRRAEKIAAELNRMRLRIVGNGTWTFERFSNVSGVSRVSACWPNKQSLGYTAGTKKRPVMAMAKAGQDMDIASGPYEGPASPMSTRVIMAGWAVEIDVVGDESTGWLQRPIGDPAYTVTVSGGEVRVS